MIIADNKNHAASFDQVRTMCETFVEESDAAESHGSKPSIMSYLKQVPEDARPALLKNLLHIEIERRTNAGENPIPDEYVEWFPEHETIIRQAFSMTIDRSVFTRQNSVAADSRNEILAVRQLGDYEIVGLLGRGGMGDVYEARHLQRDNRVALKTLPKVDGSSLHRFKREFRALADINHPNLVGLHTLESDGSHWFFTMDLIPGTDLLSYVRTAGRFDEQKLRSTFSQLVIALAALHNHHIIHRDIKPSNVMVTGDGHLYVLDFGLVVETLNANVSQTANIAGTPLYMAPEQAGGVKPTPAADWYAFGAMLYEALSGEPPFSGSMFSIMQDKQRLDAPPLSHDGIPSDLCGICMKLLAREPSDRPTVDTIAKLFATDTAKTPTPVLSSEDLVGREHQIAALQDGYRWFEKQRQPLAIFVSGRSGEGKTVLVEHFLEPLLRDSRLVVMSGRCYDRESVPFKALDSLIDALVSHLRSLPETDAALLMPDDIAVLSRVFPVLERVQVVAKASQGALGDLDQEQIRQRAFIALRSLLTRISRQTPIVLFSDDLQWGDADSAEALLSVLRPPDAPAILFVGTMRSDEADDSQFLNHWKHLEQEVEVESRNVEVGPLSFEQCIQLAISIADQDEDTVRKNAGELFKETGGNPFFLSELLSHLVAAGDSYHAIPLHEIIGHKLERLPGDAERLLRIVAISGQALGADDASKASGAESIAISTIAHMRSEKLLRYVGSEENAQIDTYHDKIRETVLAGLEKKQKEHLHLNLADTIEQSLPVEFRTAIERLQSESQLSDLDSDLRSTTRVYDLAHHYDAARINSKARLYAFVGANQARRQFAMTVSAEQYAIAYRSSSDASDELRYQICQGYGEALLQVGRYDAADQPLREALTIANDPVKYSTVKLHLGEIEFRQGKLAECTEHWEAGLSHLGTRVASSSIRLAGAIMWESLIHVIHGMSTSRLHTKQSDERTDLTIKILSRYGFAAAWRSTPKLAWAVFAAGNRGERIAPSPILAENYSTYGAMFSCISWHSRADKYLDRALALRDQFDDVWGRGQTLGWQVIMLWAAGKYRESIEAADKSIEILLKSSQGWDLNMVRFHAGCSHYALGELTEAIRLSKETFDSSIRTNDSRANCSLYLWSKVSHGALPFEELKSLFSCNNEDILSTCNLDKAEGYWHLAQDRPREAIEAFERAWKTPLSNQLVNFHTVAALAPLAGAIRRHGEHLAKTGANGKDRALKRAIKVARRAVFVSRFFPTDRPASLRELSLACAAVGKPRKAIKHANKSCLVAEQQDASYEYAQSLLVRGTIAHELGYAEGKQQIATAEEKLETFNQMIKESLIDSPKTDAQRVQHSDSLRGGESQDAS